MQNSLLLTQKAGSLRACFLAFQLLLVVLSVLLCSGRAQAYPWMIKHGYTICATCHNDASGGELLSAYGRVLSAEVLSTHWHQPAPAARTEPVRRWALTRAAHAKNAADVKAPLEASEPSTSPAPGPTAPAPAPETSPGAASPSAAPSPAAAAPAAADAEPPPEASSEAPADATAQEVPASEDEGHEFYQPFFGLFGEPNQLLLGGSLRMATLYQKGDKVRAFPMQIDLYGDYKFFDRLHVGGSLGVAKVPTGSPHARAAQITTNQGDGYNLLSRTHYVRFDFGDGNYSVSAGRLNLPFGMRMSEHVMWVRSETATDRESDQQHGVSLNMNFPTWRFELMAIAGNYQINPDKLRKRGYSGYVEYSGVKRVAFGVSSLITRAGTDLTNPSDLTDTRQAHGAFLRADLGREFVLMAEADLLLHTQTKPGYVGFAQLDFEPFGGFHVLGTGELLDRGYPKGVSEDVQPRVAGTGKAKLGGWLSAQWFFISHFDFRVDAIARQHEPLQVLGQLHVYL